MLPGNDLTCEHLQVKPNIATTTASDSDTSIHHDLAVKLPLELMIMVLEALAASSEQSQLMYLRTVSRAFDELIIEAVFQSRAFTSPRRLINGTTWRSAPESLRERYLFHLVQSRYVKPTAFTYLAAPVFEKELLEMKIVNGSKDADALVRKWCTLSMHEVWNLSWVVAHNRTMYNEHISRVERHCQFLSGRWASLSDTDMAATRRRVETDSCFLKIAMHIVNNNQDEALQLLFPTSFVCPDDLNYCFGTTVLGVAIRSGTELLIKRMLQKVPTTSEQHLHVYLRLASRRPEPDSYAITALLLDSFRDIASSRAVLVQRIFFKAIRNAQMKSDNRNSHDIETMRKDHTRVLRNVMRWTASRPAAPGMLEILQECYRRLSDRWGMPGIEDNRRRLFDRGTSGADTGPAPPRNLVPAFMYGAYYRHAVVREIVRACRGWEEYKFNCPCRSPDFNGKCSCRGTISDRCTCHMRLRGYYRPDYDRVNPGKVLFDAASRGLLHWVDWLLWAGADATNKIFEESLLFWARRGGIQNEVAELLLRHGWELTTLMTFPRMPTSLEVTTGVAPIVVEHQDESTKIEPEVWAAGSELEDSLWVAISDTYQSKFWAALVGHGQ